LAAAHELISFDQATCGGEDQRPSEIGRRIGEDVRCVRDNDAASFCGLHIDVVIADRIIRQNLQSAGRFNGSGVDAVRQGDDSCGSARQSFL